MLPTEKLYYRIGEVAKITGVKPYVLRYWESEFRWMAPQKSRSKQRLYRRKDIDTILLVKKLLYEERYTIAGARKLLREMGVGRTAETVEARALDHRTEYRRIRDELLALRAALVS
ncbi:MAG: MerR family transcriptional regulator [Myxococcales bacterium]|nr:MerR family transcriptional regulator [Myxococcales bacterium]